MGNPLTCVSSGDGKGDDTSFLAEAGAGTGETGGASWKGSARQKNVPDTRMPPGLCFPEV